ncbi:MAG: hypothetical protein AAF882_10185 [Pseudomonadota bacterium]
MVRSIDANQGYTHIRAELYKSTNKENTDGIRFTDGKNLYVKNSVKHRLFGNRSVRKAKYQQAVGKIKDAIEREFPGVKIAGKSLAEHAFGRLKDPKKLKMSDLRELDQAIADGLEIWAKGREFHGHTDDAARTRMVMHLFDHAAGGQSSKVNKLLTSWPKLTTGLQMMHNQVRRALKQAKPGVYRNNPKELDRHADFLMYKAGVQPRFGFSVGNIQRLKNKFKAEGLPLKEINWLRDFHDTSIKVLTEAPALQDSARTLAGMADKIIKSRPIHGRFGAFRARNDRADRLLDIARDSAKHAADLKKSMNNHGIGGQQERVRLLAGLANCANAAQELAAKLPRNTGDVSNRYGEGKFEDMPAVKQAFYRGKIEERKVLERHAALCMDLAQGLVSSKDRGDITATNLIRPKLAGDSGLEQVDPKIFDAEVKVPETLFQRKSTKHPLVRHTLKELTLQFKDERRQLSEALTTWQKTRDPRALAALSNHIERASVLSDRLMQKLNNLHHGNRAVVPQQQVPQTRWQALKQKIAKKFAPKPIQHESRQGEVRGAIDTVGQQRAYLQDMRLVVSVEAAAARAGGKIPTAPDLLFKWPEDPPRPAPPPVLDQRQPQGPDPRKIGVESLEDMIKRARAPGPYLPHPGDGPDPRTLGEAMPNDETDGMAKQAEGPHPKTLGHAMPKGETDGMDKQAYQDEGLERANVDPALPKQPGIGEPPMVNAEGGFVDPDIEADETEEEEVVTLGVEPKDDADVEEIDLGSKPDHGVGKPDLKQNETEKEELVTIGVEPQDDEDIDDIEVASKEYLMRDERPDIDQDEDLGSDEPDLNQDQGGGVGQVHDKVIADDDEPKPVSREQANRVVEYAGDQLAKVALQLKSPVLERFAERLHDFSKGRATVDDVVGEINRLGVHEDIVNHDSVKGLLPQVDDILDRLQE